MKFRELLMTHKKIRHNDWQDDQYIQYSIQHDEWIDESGKRFDDDIFSGTTASSWSYYIEPKKKKQITFYEYVVESLESNRINSSRLIWSNIPPEKVNGKHTGQTKTVEVEE